MVAKHTVQSKVQPNRLSAGSDVIRHRSYQIDQATKGLEVSMRVQALCICGPFQCYETMGLALGARHT